MAAKRKDPGSQNKHGRSRPRPKPKTGEPAGPATRTPALRHAHLPHCVAQRGVGQVYKAVIDIFYDSTPEERRALFLLAPGEPRPEGPEEARRERSEDPARAGSPAEDSKQQALPAASGGRGLPAPRRNRKPEGDAKPRKRRKTEDPGESGDPGGQGNPPPPWRFH